MLTKRNLEVVASWGRLLSSSKEVNWYKYDENLLQKLYKEIKTMSHKEYTKGIKGK